MPRTYKNNQHNSVLAVLRKELEYSKRVQYPGEYPKPRTKDPSGGDEDIPDISTAEEDYTYAEVGRGWIGRMPGYIIFWSAVVRNAIKHCCK